MTYYQDIDDNTRKLHYELQCLRGDIIDLGKLIAITGQGLKGQITDLQRTIEVVATAMVVATAHPDSDDEAVAHNMIETIKRIGKEYDR